MMTLLRELAVVIDKMIMHRIDQIISDDNEWFDQLIDDKIKERMEKNGSSTT